MKIIACEITAMPRPMPEGMFDDMPKVIVTFEDGHVEELFSFFPDEISFTEKEFLGLTETEARQRKFLKDKDFLQS